MLPGLQSGATTESDNLARGQERVQQESQQTTFLCIEVQHWQNVQVCFS